MLIVHSDFSSAAGLIIYQVRSDVPPLRSMAQLLHSVSTFLSRSLALFIYHIFLTHSPETQDLDAKLS